MRTSGDCLVWVGFPVLVVFLSNLATASGDLGKFTEFRPVKITLGSATLQEDRGLRVSFGVGDYPNIMFHEKQEPALDWSAYGGLTVEVTNPGSEDVPLNFRFDDDPGADGSTHTLNASGVIPHGQKARVLIFFEPISAPSMGMQEAPRVKDWNLFKVRMRDAFDRSKIHRVEAFLNHPKTPQTLIFSKISLIQGGGARDFLYQGIMDRYGQFTLETWPGKIMRDQDLIQARAREVASRVGHAASSRRYDFYGGSLDAPLGPVGHKYFRTYRASDGKWWLVTPEGHLFFSIGVDSVHAEGAGATVVEGREFMFQDLPAPDSKGSAYYLPASPHPGWGLAEREIHFNLGKSFDFYQANLERRFDTPDFHALWAKETTDRLKDWGFNTIGNWSDLQTFEKAGASTTRVPYVMSLTTAGDFSRVPSKFAWWGPIPDPFDPRFEAAVDANFKSKIKTELQDDPYLIGYFVDNEIGWAGERLSDKDPEHFALAYGALTQGDQLPAKKEWLEILKKRYGTITALNQSWKADFPSWDGFLAQPYTAPSPALPTESMRADFSQFLKMFAERYFSVVSKTLKKYDPNHLYLGSRFAHYAIEEVEACAKFCDVLSFNVYAKGIFPDFWKFLTPLGKPAIIGEFHFGALDRGAFGMGLGPVENQAERAASYTRYMRDVALNPAFVGAHWFEYVDEPATGRRVDGENFGIGLVTITDLPYPELTEAARETNAHLVEWRLANPQTHASRAR